MLLFTSDNPPMVRVQRVLKRVARVNLLFILTVLVPTAVAVWYYGFIASNIYVSEARFVVRSPQQQSSTGVLGAMITGAVGIQSSKDDAYTVQDFILSRDALRQLDEKLKLRTAFSHSEIDRPNRFPSLIDMDDSFEGLYRYYPKRVSVAYDATSSIATLSVSAFTPRDAQQINEQLLSMSERLVNQINQRALQDSIKYAAGVVKEMEDKAKAAAIAVADFRNQRSIFDPEKQSAMQLGTITKLQEELIATRGQLDQVRRLSRDNPQVPVLAQQVKMLEQAIAAERQGVAGATTSLTSHARDYERLALEREFAEKQLASALASLELARAEAQKKQLYLERIVQPNLPDHNLEPHRLRSILMVFVLSLVAWGVLGLLITAIREHRA